ncbi:MAG: histidine phosphatase family protein [Leptothrix sp. (in: Bacteria)]|nr:histidine phosphatase family protein [Leptothrix sp. (in: b-proteobacteria)]
MTELLFIRHGETDWNRQQRFQGHIDVPLNDTGRDQAARLAARLAAEQHDLLFSSDLQRARQTAAPLAAAWGRDDGVLPGFREQGFGLLEGLDAPTIQAEQPALWRGWLQQDADFAAPGGESQRQFHARVLAAVRELVDRHAGRRVVVVTHGGVLDMLWRSAHGLPLAGLRQCHIPNTGINRLRWVDGVLCIESWGDDSHLADAGAG